MWGGDAPRFIGKDFCFGDSRWLRRNSVDSFSILVPACPAQLQTRLKSSAETVNGFENGRINFHNFKEKLSHEQH